MLTPLTLNAESAAGGLPDFVAKGRSVVERRMLLPTRGGTVVTQVFEAETGKPQNRPKLHHRVGFALMIALGVVLCASMYGGVIWACVALVRAAGF